ncbi:MAG: NTP transferase domain-containing protein, partial [Intrasporangium sp.]|uniref:nucleotidyltransferase family protein n=1 Tax=Intrasporangium sp. TaxID=1925024 RepID=UPI00264956C4
MPPTSPPRVRGLVLAAGAGRRMGGPKALLPAPAGGTLVAAAIRVLLSGGCDGVTVVLGAAAEDVRAAVGTVPVPKSADIASPEPDIASPEPDIDVVECPDWADGMGASLRTGLRHIRELADYEAVLVTLVDLPDVTPDVTRRLLT